MNLERNRVMYALQENSMPTNVVLPDPLVAKMQTVAVPFKDTPLSVIERAVDALIEKMHGSGGTQYRTATPGPSDGSVVYPAEAPPSLKFTKPLAITLEGKALPKNELYWNLLLFRVISLSAVKMDKQALRDALLVNYLDGKIEGSGYRYIPEGKLSVQGSDAINAWNATVFLVKAAGLKVDVMFRWGTQEGAANPGQVARMSIQ
jgi:hypothetical protein